MGQTGANIRRRVKQMLPAAAVMSVVAIFIFEMTKSTRLPQDMAIGLALSIGMMAGGLWCWTYSGRSLKEMLGGEDVHQLEGQQLHDRRQNHYYGSQVLTQLPQRQRIAEIAEWLAFPQGRELWARRAIKAVAVLVALPVIVMVVFFDFSIVFWWMTFLVDVVSGRLPLSQVSVELAGALSLGVLILVGTGYGAVFVKRKWTKVWGAAI